MFSIYLFLKYKNKPGFIISDVQDLHLLHCKIHFTNASLQKQPPRGVVKKKCFENMQQIYTRKPMPNSDFSKVALQLY